MTYAIAGVTGHTGKVAAETLLAKGQKVRVIVRDRAKAEPFVAQGAEVAVADLGDAASLAEAFKGVDGAYVLIPPKIAPGFGAYQRATADAITAAAKSSRLPHLVLLSSIGAELPEGNGPIRGLYYAEQQLRALDTTRTTFLRAAYFMENLGGSLGMLDQGLLPSFTPADFAYEMVATVDIGKAVATLLLEGAKSTQVVNLPGYRRSFGDAARMLSEILGKSIQVAEAPIEAATPTFMSFGFPEELAGMYQEMIEGMYTGRIVWQAEPRKLQGTTDLDVVLRGILGKG